MKLYALILSLVFLFSTQAQPHISPPEPDHYRLDSYRAPVPLTLAGAKVISTAQAFDLWKKKYAVFIDALPHAPKPEGLPASVVWREPIRNDIPGSLWLADTGYGLLADVMLRYFEEGLIKATAADKDRPLVFYCLKDCWMSWNAAKRALSIGYRHVYWYPEGSDGWAAAGHPLEARQPEPHRENIYTPVIPFQ